MQSIPAVPLPPGPPNVVDWSDRHMDLQWSEPLDDGGAAITAYHVESKIKGEDEDWQLWETIDTNRTKVTLQKLEKGKEYQFRIIAINKAGKSDASHPSRSKQAIPRSRNYKNDRFKNRCLVPFAFLFSSSIDRCQKSS